VGSSSSRQEKAAATTAGSGVVGGQPGALYWSSSDGEGLDSEVDCRILFGCNC
jgi:hypothetical protein